MGKKTSLDEDVESLIFHKNESSPSARPSSPNRPAVPLLVSFSSDWLWRPGRTWCRDKSLTLRWRRFPYPAWALWRASQPPRSPISWSWQTSTSWEPCCPRYTFWGGWGRGRSASRRRWGGGGVGEKSTSSSKKWIFFSFWRFFRKVFPKKPNIFQ